MIGGRRPHRCKEGAALAVRGQIPRPAETILTGQCRKGFQIIDKAFEFGVNNRIRAIRRYDTTGPAAVAYRLMVAQIVEWVLGCGDNLNIITLKQCPRPEGTGFELCGNLVIIMV